MSYIPEALRRQIVENAHECCEYCRVHQRDLVYTFEVDHIIPEKHRGETDADNLCLSCLNCNRYKGSDFASFDPRTGEIERLYNPRRDHWDKHFRLNGAVIEALSSIGRVTEFVLRLNEITRLQHRMGLLEIGHYPCNATAE